MRNKKLFSLLVLALLCVSQVSIFAQEEAGPFTKFENRLQWEDEGELYWIDAYGVDALRFRGSKSLRINDENWNLLPQKDVQLEITITPTKAIVKNGRIRAEIAARKGRITYLNDKDEVLLMESINSHHPQFARQWESKGSDHFKTKVTFDADQDEKIFGMGQYPNDCLNLKGTVLELAQKNTQISIPFFISTKGYGFLWNNPAIGRAEFSMTHTSFFAEYTKQVDYIIMAGDTPAELVMHYSTLTGTAPKMPEYATGLWQSKLRYYSQEDLLSVVREYKERELPISVIVADFYHWPISGDWKFNPEFWPDPKAMVDELNAMDVNLLVSVWPTLAKGSENYKTFRAKNYTIRPEHGNNLFLEANDDLTYVDVTHPGARKALWSKLQENYYDLGVRMFWMDEAEPEIEPLEYNNIRYYLGNGEEVSCIYPFYYAKTIYDGQVSNGQKDGEIINLIRSGWIGSQRFGTLLWSGDIPGTFDMLRRQIKAGLNISLCGIPWWNTDIGGFYGNINSEPYREILLRWYQYAVFTPVMRMHGVNAPSSKIEGQITGTGSPNEIWSFGEEAYGVMKNYLMIRERLRPYIQKHMDIASENGSPVMRPMFFDYPDDENCYVVDDQFMFGPDILVAPVIEEGATSRKVYLPAGTTWTNALTGKKHKGGQTIDLKVDINNIPVFTTNGSDFRL